MSLEGNAIAQLRAKEGYSRAELARLAGVSSEYIRKLEIGETFRPSHMYLMKIAMVFGLTPADLMYMSVMGEEAVYERNEPSEEEMIVSLARQHNLAPEDLRAWIEALEAMPPEVRDYELQGAKLRARGQPKSSKKRLNENRLEYRSEPPEEMEG